MRRLRARAALVPILVAASVRAAAAEPRTAAEEALAAFSDRVYAEFGRAAEAIPLDGETLDRLTVFSRLATEPDAAKRKRYFLALEGVRSTIAGPPAGPSPYRELVRLRREAWLHAGSAGAPFDAAAKAWGLAPETLEAWLVRVLEAWRDTLPPGEIEPWDLAWSSGAADRSLAELLPKRRMIETSVRFVTDLGAPPKELGIELDLAPRRGKDPVAFTDFVRKPKLHATTWRGGRYRVSASYREGGLANLYELTHELGHALHIAAIRPREAKDVAWPDDDVFTEALADMIGVTVYDPLWQQRYVGVAAPEAASMRARLAPAMLDICWALFEWRVHRDPEASPDEVWSDLTRNYLRVVPHPEIAWWAVRGQLVNAPGYMMNYALGTILTEDLRAGVAASRGPDAFAAPKPGLYLWLAGRLYRFGTERPSRAVVESFLRGPLDPAPLLGTISKLRAED